MMRYIIWPSGILDGVKPYIAQTFLSFALTGVMSFAFMFLLCLIPGSEYIAGWRNKRKNL